MLLLELLSRSILLYFGEINGKLLLLLFLARLCVHHHMALLNYLLAQLLLRFYMRVSLRNDR